MTVFALGLIVGSFLNVCIHRWPLGQSVVAPRSRCPDCSTPIAWYDNIPLLSYALLRGRCRACESRIPKRYPIVELITAASFAAIAAKFGFGLEAAKAAALVALLTVLFFTDLQHFVLPDPATLGGLAAGLAFSPFVPLRPGLAEFAYFMAGAHPQPWVISLSESVLGAALFGCVSLALNEMFFFFRGVEGLGMGDVKLVAMLAAFQGTSETLLIMLVGCVIAISIGGATILAHGRDLRTAPLPFGSYLSAAAFGSVFFGDAILNRYWEFMLG